MENNLKLQQGLSRRGFLKLSAGAGAALVGGYVLSEYTPWLNYGQQVQKSRSPFCNSSAVPAQMGELVRCATLAANGHNTQPWKFAIKENEIEIHPDYTRRLAVVDPNDRELWISLGCALENLRLAASAMGYAASVIYPDRQDFIGVRLSAAAPERNSLAEAIPFRQNTRSEFDGRRLNKNELDQLQGMSLEPGTALQFLTTGENMNMALEYVNQGNLIQYANEAFVDELTTWLRFNKKEVLASCDGLYSPCSGNPEVPRWLGSMFVAGTKPQQQADSDAKKLRSSAGAFVIASETDDKTGWVRTGQVYERMALKMTSMNIKSALLNQPIETKDLRAQFQAAAGLGNSLPQLLVRFGYAEALPHSLRRPVEQVLL